ncbi:3-beta-hydroxysteroid sulfotransferase-like [Dipodomys merriami]|uniref:3-beta-hydroxysteroid sulfotransferase-like n=1 Tax=Dipodomys merriami TaxID=94247 RepID=UPI003855D7EF
MAQDYVWYQGIPFPAVGYNPEVTKAAYEKLVLKDEDIITVTYPKSDLRITRYFCDITGKSFTGKSLDHRATDCLDSNVSANKK